MACDACTRFFERFRCNTPGECDCPRCQGLCTCSPTVITGAENIRAFAQLVRARAMKLELTTGLVASSKWRRIWVVVRKELNLPPRTSKQKTYEAFCQHHGLEM